MSLAYVGHNGMYHNGPDIIQLPRHARREGKPYNTLFCCETSNVNSFFYKTITNPIYLYPIIKRDKVKHKFKWFVINKLTNYLCKQ